MNETRRAGFGGLDIQRTPMGTRVTLLAERPGLVIGRKGGAIKSLTEAVDRQFKFDNPQIEVQEVSAPALNAQIMAEKLANALEIKQPSAEYIAAAASFVRPVQAPVVVEPEPALAVQATVGPEGADEEPEPLIEPGEREATTAKVKKSKVAAKRLKKVAKEVKQLGVDVDVDAEGGDGA